MAPKTPGREEGARSRDLAAAVPVGAGAAGGERMRARMLSRRTSGSRRWAVRRGRGQVVSRRWAVAGLGTIEGRREALDGSWA